MGELRNCPACGKLFVRVSRNLCPDCIKIEEEKFEEVRLYLKDTPGASIEEIAEKFEIEENTVTRWIREGRIEGVNVSSALTCQRCGVPIRIGNLCSDCAQRLSAQMSSKPKPVSNNGPIRGMLSRRTKDD